MYYYLYTVLWHRLLTKIFEIDPVCLCITENNDFDDYVLPSSLIDMVTEKCTICDGGGDDFEYANDVSTNDEDPMIAFLNPILCSDKIWAEQQYDFLMTVNACKEFKDSCIICHSSDNNNTSAP